MLAGCGGAEANNSDPNALSDKIPTTLAQPESTVSPEILSQESIEYQDLGVYIRLTATGMTLPLNVTITEETMHGKQELFAADQVVLTQTKAPSNFLTTASKDFMADAQENLDGKIFFYYEDLDPEGTKRRIHVEVKTIVFEGSTAQLSDSDLDPELAQKIQGDLDEQYGQSVSTYTDTASFSVGGKTATNQP